MKIEEVYYTTLLERNNFADDDQLLLEITGLIDNLGELTGDTPQVARENLDLLRTAVGLWANAVEFLLQINRSRSVPLQLPATPYKSSAPCPHRFSYRLL